MGGALTDCSEHAACCRKDDDSPNLALIHYSRALREYSSYFGTTDDNCNCTGTALLPLKRFALVGILESMDQFLSRLCNFLELEPHDCQPVPRERVNTARPDNVTEELRAFIASHVQEDIAIYEEAKAMAMAE